jgi:hypothetical protein
METTGNNEHVTFDDETDADQSVDENENSEDESSDDGISGDDDIDQVCAICDDGGELLRYVSLSTSLSSIRPLCFPIIHAFGTYRASLSSSQSDKARDNAVTICTLWTKPKPNKPN